MTWAKRNLILLQEVNSIHFQAEDEMKFRITRFNSHFTRI
jgi:hypothetical protein